MEQKNEENVYVEKKIFVFSLFLLGILIISAIILSYFLLSDKILENNINFTTEPDLPVYENLDNTKSENEKIYMLKEYNGKIGIYENEALVYTLNTYVFTLPEIDKLLLKEGITVTNKTELYDLIEEYY